jgi:hypothetical protein
MWLRVEPEPCPSIKTASAGSALSQIQQREEFVEFLTPDVLKGFGLPERFRNATFDRELAIRRTDAEFLALGHPFVDSMLSYVGCYDFGGLTANRRIVAKELAGISGCLFAFVVRRRITRENGDECLFDFCPVFVRTDKSLDPAAAWAAVNLSASADAAQITNPSLTADLFGVAKTHLEQSASLWDWEEDVEFIGMSWVVFTSD